MNVAHQALLSMGFSRQGYWSGLLCPPPEDLTHLGIKLWLCTANGFFTGEPAGTLRRGSQSFCPGGGGGGGIQGKLRSERRGLGLGNKKAFCNLWAVRIGKLFYILILGSTKQCAICILFSWFQLN